MATSYYDTEVRLGFTADINEARREMNQLQMQLEKLSVTPISTKGFEKQITQANNEVLKLSTLLKDSFNVDTGKLDINRFITQMDQYGMSLKDIKHTLASFGDEGQVALQQLNSQIIQGETGIVQMSNALTNFAKQMKRTMSIQLSYGIMNSFIDNFRSAYSYAQDLNESLTNIQIVTSKSTDEMRQFAVEANKAAKNLSTTTTAYSDAALIYYQQGLSDEEVQKRTDTTIKLANVTGQSAEEVSSSMTAIWNNFAKTGDNLERYADIITALGAATASSSQEISDGLSQFSAVADTVGLSYEFATSALATVVSQTRQSADTVGNAFKTIFARLESLNLGDTLDDDTTLTKYTQALEKVGVSVTLQNGELKDMDSILTQLGEKWSNLSDQQKNALAYTVAGARQYTNFIALMDNWGKVEDNLQIAQNAEGTLQKQADIYADSWEAANKRLKASWQELYDLVISDDFFIGLINGTSAVVEGISSLVKSLGGLKGLLPTIIALTTQLFSKQIADGAASLALNFKSAKNAITGADKKMQQYETGRFSLFANNTDQTKTGDLTATKEKQIQLLQEFQEKQSGMNELEKQYQSYLIRRNQILMDNADKANNAYADELGYLDDIKQKFKEIDNIQSDNYKLAALESSLTPNKKGKINKNQSPYTVGDLKSVISPEKFDELGLSAEKASKKLSKLSNAHEVLDAIGEQIDKNHKLEIESIRNVNGSVDEYINSLGKNLETSQEKINNYDERLEALKKEYKEYQNGIKDAGNNEDGRVLTTENYEKAIEDLNKKLQEERDNYNKTEEEVKRFKQGVDSSTDSQDNFFNKTEEAARKVEDLVSALTSTYAFYNSLTQAVDDLSEGHFNLSNAISLVTTGFMAFNTVNNLTNNGLAATAMSISRHVGKVFHLVGADETLSASEIKLALANNTLKASFIEIALPIMALVGIIGLLIAAFKGLEDSTPEAQLKKMSDEAENASKALEETENNAKKLAEAFNGYEEIQNKLHSLDTGTREWNEALKESNNAVLELLKTYPELATYLDASDPNELKIREEGFYDLANKQNLELAKKIGESNFADNTLRENQLNRQRGSLSAELMQNGADVEDDPNKGTYARNLILDNAELFIGKTATQIQAALNDLFKDNNIKIENLSDWAKAIQSSDIGSYASVSESNNTVSRLENASTAQRFLESQGMTDAYQYSSIAGKFYADSAEKYYGEYLNKITDRGLFNTSTATSEEAWKQYYENNAELQKLKDFEVTNFKGDGDIEYSYTDEEGNKQVETITAETIARGLAVNDAFKALEETGKNLNAAFADLDEQAKTNYENGDSDAYAANEGLKAALNGGLGSVDTNTFGIFKDKIFGENGYNPNNTEDINEKIKQYLSESGVYDSFKEFGFNSAEEMINSFSEQIQNYSTEDNKKAEDEAAEQDIYASGEKAGLKKEEMEEYADYLSEISDDIDEVTGEANDLADSLKDDKVASAALAKDIMKMNSGIEKLAKSYDNCSDVLKNSTKESKEYLDSINELKDGVSDLLDVDKEFISSDFIEKHLEDIGKAAKGDEEAIARLQLAAAQDIVLNAAMDDKDFNDKKDLLLSKTEELMNWANNNSIEIGTKIDTDNLSADEEEFINACNEIIKNAHMTAEEATAYFNAMGFEPTFVTEEKQILTKKPVIKTVTEDDGSYDKPDGTHITKTKTWSYNAGYKYLWETQEVPALSTDGGVPQIKTITRTTNGSKGAALNNYSTKNAGGPSPSGKTSKSSGGGGGNDSKKEFTPKTKELKEEKDRYYVITKQLDAISNNLDKVSRAKDRAFGRNKIDAVRNEMSVYEDYIDAQKRYLDEIDDYLNSDKQSVITKYGAEFDQYGNIVNYDKVLKDAVDKYNDLGSKEETAEQADKFWEEFEKDIKNYEESVKLAQDETKKLDEYIDKLHDSLLEMSEYAFEFNVKINDSELKYVEYLMGKVDDKARDSAQSLALIGKQMDLNAKKIQMTQNNLADILSIGANAYTYDAEGNLTGIDRSVGETLLNQLISGEITYQQLSDQMNLTQDEMDKLMDGVDTLISDTKTLQDNWDAYIDTMNEFWDAWDEKFDKELNKYDRLNNITSNYKELIEIIGKDRLGITNETLKTLDKTVNEQYLQKTQGLYKQYIDKQAALTAMKAQNLDQSIIDQAQESLDELFESLQSAQAEAAQQFEDAYTNSIEIIFEEWEKGIAGSYKTMENLTDSFSRQKTVSDLYLDTYDQAYKISKLTRDINKSIDDTDNIKSKRELAKITETIQNKQKEGKKLSEDELGFYQKQYELLLARQALEDARNNKSQVRMTRDNEGNMSYVYTVDENEIDKAEEKYSDIAHSFAESLQSVSEKNQEALVSLTQEYEEALRKAAEEHRELTDEEAEYFETRFANVKEQLDIVFDWNNYLSDLGTVTEGWDLENNFTDTLLSNVFGASSVDEILEKIQQTTNVLKESIKDAQKELDDYIDELRYEDGKDILLTYGSAEDLDSSLSMIEEETIAVTDSIQTLGEEFSNTVSEMVPMAKILQESIQGTMDGITDSTESATEALLGLFKVWQVDTNNVYGNKDVEFTTKSQSYTNNTYSYDGLYSTYNIQGLDQYIEDEIDNKNNYDIAIENIISEISKMINGNTPSVSLSDWYATASKLFNPVMNLEQEVTIHAEFPSVKDRNEIEEAFNNLVNRASQYANRKY